MKLVSTLRVLVSLSLICALGCLTTANAQIADATALFQGGDTEAALVMLDDLRERYPDDVDYMLLRAQIYTEQDRIDLALDELRLATSLAPRYEDLWRLRFTLLSNSTDIELQQERLDVRQIVAEEFPDSTWWQVASVATPEIRWSALIGAGYDRLDNGQPSWNQQFFEISRRRRGLDRHHVAIARDQRFSNSDVSVRAGSEFHFASDWLAGLEVSAASDPSFSAQSSYRVFLGRTFDNGWGATLAVQRRNYETATVSITSAGIERYIGAYRFAYSLAAAHLHGASNSIGHGLTSNWYYSEKASIGVSINSGDEAEAVGPGQVLETRVRGIALTGHQDISEKTTLRWWLGLHEQGDFYRRQFLGMAVSIAL